MQFYQDSSNGWHLGDEIIPANTCSIIIDGLNISIQVVGQSTPKVRDLVTNFQDKDGNNYTNIKDFLKDTEGFFIKAPFGLGGLLGTLFFIDGQSTDTSIETGSINHPFKTFGHAVAAMTDLTKSYSWLCTPSNYVDTVDCTIPAVVSLDIYANGSSWTVPNVTVNCHANIYDLSTTTTLINYAYTGTERSVRDNGKIVGNVTIAGGFPHIQNLNFTGIMTVTGGTPYIKDITGGGRIVVNGSSAVLIMSNPNMNMPTVDAANITCTSGQVLCHGGLMVNKGTSYPNIVLSNTNTISTFHSFSDLTCNIGITAGSAYTVISPSMLSPLLTGTALLYLPSDVRSQYGVGGGTAQAQTVTIPSTGSSYFYGMIIKYVPTVSNTATAPTVNVNAWGAKTVKRGLYSTSDAIVAGDLPLGKTLMLMYDGTNLRLMNPISIV